MNFGQVTVGKSKSLTATLSASGGSVTVSSATLPVSEFSLSGISFPFTIAAGQQISFAVKFTPQASGAASGSVSFKSNASDPSVVEALTGTGVAAVQHRVTLSWNPSTAAVIGYNVYRSETPGGPYRKINSVLDSSTTYTDGSVLGGKTYYYVTTSVSSRGEVSRYSSQVRAIIPLQ